MRAGGANQAQRWTSLAWIFFRRYGQHSSLLRFCRYWEHDLTHCFQPAASLNFDPGAGPVGNGGDLSAPAGSGAFQPAYGTRSSWRGGVAADDAKLCSYSPLVPAKPVLGTGAAADRDLLYGRHFLLRVQVLVRTRRRVERQDTGSPQEPALTRPFSSGTHKNRLRTTMRRFSSGVARQILLLRFACSS